MTEDTLNVTQWNFSCNPNSSEHHLSSYRSSAETTTKDKDRTNRTQCLGEWR